MSNTIGSEPTRHAHARTSTAAARNIASAEQIVACYEQLLQTVCQHGIRIPELASLVGGPAEQTSAQGPIQTDSGEGAESTPSTDTDPHDARRFDERRLRYWLGREENLRRRWHRIQAWLPAERGWVGRRNALSSELVRLRAEALRNATVDRRLLDTFIEGLVSVGASPSRLDDDTFREELEQRYDVSVAKLKTLTEQVCSIREAIRSERGRMIHHNRSLVAGIARRFVGKGMLLEDLIQEGTLGLLRAIDKFDPARGFQFSTYAIWWIRQGVSRAVVDQGRSVRIPVHLKEQTTRMRAVELRLTHRFGRTPTRIEIADAVGLSETKVQQLQQQLLTDVSLQRPLHGDGDGELGDALEDEKALQPFQAMDRERLAEHLGVALSQLDARSRFVVCAHLGLGGQAPLTLDGISLRLGISRERVRQIEREALNRLRRSAGETHLEEHA